MMFALVLDRIAPYLRWIAFAAIIAVTVGALLLVGQCSRRDAAQSRQDVRSARAGTDTAVEALDTLEQAQERDAGTDRIVAQGKKDIADAKSDLEVDAAGRAALCRMRVHSNDPACRLLGVHP